MSRIEYYGYEYIDLNGVPHQMGRGERFGREWAFYSFNSEPEQSSLKSEEIMTHAEINGGITFEQATVVLEKYKHQKELYPKLVSMLEQMIKDETRRDAKSNREVNLD